MHINLSEIPLYQLKLWQDEINLEIRVREGVTLPDELIEKIDELLCLHTPDRIQATKLYKNLTGFKLSTSFDWVNQRLFELTGKDVRRKELKQHRNNVIQEC